MTKSRMLMQLSAVQKFFISESWPSDEIPVKRWSTAGQTLVKRWSMLMQRGAVQKICIS